MKLNKIINEIDPTLKECIIEREHMKKDFKEMEEIIFIMKGNIDKLEKDLADTLSENLRIREECLKTNSV